MSPTDVRRTPHAAATVIRLVQTLRSIQMARGECPWLVLNLTMAQVKAMMLLAQTGGVRSRELADGLGIAPSAVTPLVDRLVDQKLAERHDDPDDRRIIWVRPTATGLQLHDELMQTSERALNDVFKELPADARPKVQESLRMLLEAAERVLAKQRQQG